MTVCEVAHSRTESEIEKLVEQLRPVLGNLEVVLEEKAEEGRKARFECPMVMIDGAGVAISFLPCAQEEGKDGWGYHHLRAEVFEVVEEAVAVGSRYVVPSAHLAIARYVREIGREEVERLVGAIDRVNEVLERAFDSGEVDEEILTREGLESGMASWTVGEEKGLELRAGACWYGDGGRTVTVGKSISAE